MRPSRDPDRLPRRPLSAASPPAVVAVVAVVADDVSSVVGGGGGRVRRFSAEPDRARAATSCGDGDADGDAAGETWSMIADNAAS